MPEAFLGIGYKAVNKIVMEHVLMKYTSRRKSGSLSSLFWNVFIQYIFIELGSTEGTFFVSEQNRLLPALRQLLVRVNRQ